MSKPIDLPHSKLQQDPRPVEVRHSDAPAPNLYQFSKRQINIFFRYAFQNYRGPNVNIRIKSRIILRLSFLLCVIVPTAASAFYLYFIATDQYPLETRFAVRMAQFAFDRDANDKSSTKGTSGSMASLVPSLASQEAHVVAAYIRSPAILDDLSNAIDLRSLFTRPEADFWARLAQNSPREDLTRYWRSMVDASVNTMSGVVTVSVKTFRPQDSLDLAGAIIKASEQLVNRLSQRARSDAMGKAEQEVRVNEQRVRTAMEEMRAYRDKEKLISPSSEASSTSTLLIQAMSERINLQAEYFVATRAMSPDAPSVTVLKTKLDAIDDQIARLKNQMTGNDNPRTISAAITQFEELELKRQFAEKLYMISQSALERARQRAEWQSIYLSVFVPPALPELSLFPQRGYFSIMTFFICLILWGIIALTAAAIRDHIG